MVTFKPVGRLGNFLFAAASAMAYAWEHNLEYSLPSSTRDTQWHPVYLPHLVNPLFNPSKPEVVVTENTFTWHQREFRPEWSRGNIRLEGYWQNEKYFRIYRQRILDIFNYPWKLNTIKMVSVHVRRGDYLTISKGSMLKHPPVTAAWYRQQMEKFPGACFAFFSDDLPWCIEEFGKEANTIFAPRFVKDSFLKKASHQLSPEEVDLVSMSCCEHHICSASTFSWWAAYLNRNPKKRVIMPKHWITPGWSNLDFSEVVPKEWERA